MFTLVGQESSVGRHLGHLVEIKGKATNIGNDGKVEVTTKTKVEREDGDDTVTKAKSEIEGPAAPAYLGVRSGEDPAHQLLVGDARSARGACPRFARAGRAFAWARARCAAGDVQLRFIWPR